MRALQVAADGTVLLNMSHVIARYNLSAADIGGRCASHYADGRPRSAFIANAHVRRLLPVHVWFREGGFMLTYDDAPGDAPVPLTTALASQDLAVTQVEAFSLVSTVATIHARSDATRDVGPGVAFGNATACSRVRVGIVLVMEAEFLTTGAELESRHDWVVLASDMSPRFVQYVTEAVRWFTRREVPRAELQRERMIREAAPAPLLAQPPPVAVRQPRVCAVCGAASSTRCARCNRVYYCSRVCQRRDWRAHKPACVPEN